MAASIGPAFVKVNSHSAKGPHVSLWPTLAWSPGADQGVFNTHAGGTTDADTMITDLATALAGILPDTSSFDNYVIYTQEEPEDPPRPVAQGNLSIVGLDATPGWYQATQVTMNFRTSNFGAMKIVTLDAATNNDFSKVTVLPGSGVLFTVFGLLAVSTNGWAGRDNGQVEGFVSQTVTLNEKLRRSYRLA